MSNPTVLVGNRTGGQGKTLITQIINLGYRLGEGSPSTLVAADSLARDGNLGASKLGSIYSEVEELGIGAGLSQTLEDGRSAVSYWDKIGQHLKNGGAIIDFGANVLPMVFDWAQQRRTSRILSTSRIHLVVPITAQPQSLSDAVDILSTALSDKCELKTERQFAVFNEVHGKFDAIQGSDEYAQLMKLLKKPTAHSVKLPLCRCELWSKIESQLMRMNDLVEMPYEDWQKVFKTDEFLASAAQHDYSVWLASAIDAFRKVGLIPEGRMPETLAAAAA